MEKQKLKVWDGYCERCSQASTITGIHIKNVRRQLHGSWSCCGLIALKYSLDIKIRDWFFRRGTSHWQLHSYPFSMVNGYRCNSREFEWTTNLLILIDLLKNLEIVWKITTDMKRHLILFFLSEKQFTQMISPKSSHC